MQSDSDAALDNAKQEVLFCFVLFCFVLFCYRQLLELEPASKALEDRKPTNVSSDNLVQNAFYMMEKMEFDSRYRDILSKIMMAQVKYIQLLERRIGK